MIGDDWVLNHVGMTVGDRNATLRHFQSLGVGVSVGPQPLLPHEDGEGSLMFYRTLEGDPVTNTYVTGGAHNFTDGECQIGDCQLECYPMRPGPGMFLSEYLAEKGAGINHICFNTPSVEEDTQVLIGRGCAVMFNATVNNRTVENYLDSRRHGDLMLSLRPPASDWENMWKANNETHPLVNDWHFKGVGIAVHSLDQAIDYYGELGFVAVHKPQLDEQFAMRWQSVRVGPLAFDFCEPDTPDSLCAQVLEQRGEGVFDLRFMCDELAAEQTRLTARGLQQIPEQAAGSACYFDTRAEGNTLVRLQSQPFQPAEESVS